MMKMLKLLGLMVFVVCIAAFASGCGGGGGGGSAQVPDTTPPMVEPDPEPTEPAEPTDAERIAAARQLLATILTDANNLAQMASSTAAAVQFHPDATAEQIASALTQADAAQTALTIVVAASSAGNAAATLAQAQLAVADAQAALNDLTAAQSVAASIQSAVEAVASQRQQMQADEAALTNNSSLIQHVRDNKLLSDALLDDLETARLLVGGVGSATTINDDDTETCTAPCATFPANTGTVVGQRGVRVGTLISNSNTPPLTGTGRLPHGFNLEMEDTPSADITTFINAYTDISQTRLKVRTRTNFLEDDEAEGDRRYEEVDVADTNYLLAGVWMTVNNANLGESQIQAFAYGSQPIVASFNFCSGIEGPTDPVSTQVTSTATPPVTTTTTRACAPTAGLSTIAGANGFVDEGKDVTATYTGDANGAYIAGGDTSYFTGSVELTAAFQNPITQGNMVAEDGKGSIQGSVTNITAGGQSIAGSIELQKQTLGNDISTPFAGAAVGVVDGKSFGGNWRGQFFGLRHKPKTTETDTEHTRDGNGDITATAITITTTYKPDAPGSVAGTFFVKQLSNPAGEAAFIGAFGAKR